MMKKWMDQQCVKNSKFFIEIGLIQQQFDRKHSILFKPHSAEAKVFFFARQIHIRKLSLVE